MASKKRRAYGYQGEGSTLGYLVQLLDSGYSMKSWHGPNLKGSIRGVSPDLAGWRAGLERHSIGEIVLHAAYWKYVVRRKLRGEPRGSFARAGSNWFELPDAMGASEWLELKQVLDDEHRQLRAAVWEFEPARLSERPGSSRMSFSEIVQGVAFHDVYHAGQIQLIRRMAAAV